MKWISLLVGLLLSFTLSIAAQNDSTTTSKETKKKKVRTIELYGEVYDSFTKARIKAFITLMRTDSSTVDTTSCMAYSTVSYYSLKVPAVQDDFIIKATAEGYEDTYLNYQLRHIARNNYFSLPRILMKKKQDDIWRENDLEGVTVTGTRVKIAYRGDTLVFNAAAFNLPEGSMLDGLIRQMPGAELKDNGDIYINGKKVDYLTLNGKDFFKGQNKVMLDNLPYFTVRDIKVYNKSTKQSELVGRDIEKKDYVMDVELKREYNRGYMGNIETGGGTDNRFMARLFGLYYSDHSRISLYGNTNNVNETRRPGGEGEWSPSEMPQGLRTTRETGMHISTEDADKKWEERADATFSWNSAENLRRTATEHFATGGNIIGGSESWSKQRDFSLSLSNQFTVQKPIILFSYMNLNYSNGHRDTHSEDSTWQQKPINHTLNLGLNKYRRLSFNSMAGWYKKFDWGDIISLRADVSYGEMKPSDNFSRSETHYTQSHLDDLRDKYNDTREKNYQYQFGGEYSLQMPNKWSIDPSVNFQQSMNEDRDNLFRLDWLNATDKDPHEIGWLPSSREQLMSVMDTDNSVTQQIITRSYTGRLTVNRSDDNQYISFDLPVKHITERLNYNDHRTDTVARRHYTTFTPSFGYYQWGKKKGLQNINFNMDISRPSLTSLMPHDNTSNPLSTWINNPSLKPRVSYNLNIAFQFDNDSIRRFFRTWGAVNLTRNSWGTRTTYDKETGAYTLMNDNINGNWSSNVGCTFQQPLDRKKLLMLKQRTEANYTHSVDFPIIYVASGTERQADKSTVNNWILHERLELEFQKDKLTAAVVGDINWHSSTSDREDFERISAFDFNYGARLMYVIPVVKLSLATDIKMFSRRGYNSSMMNTDDLVWNAELSRSLLKEKVTLKLTAFDLLHQLSNKVYSVNAQGRTETWNNCIPRYLMLTCALKLNKMPKMGR